MDGARVLLICLESLKHLLPAGKVILLQSKPDITVNAPRFFFFLIPFNMATKNDSLSFMVSRDSHI